MLTPDMLVTSDPVAELDAALDIGSAQLRTAHQRGVSGVVEYLTRWVDTRLNQRSGSATVHRPP
ncbi:MAG: hypothetical protein GEV28_15765 [Actinophytocola sp.]|uniref:hypothetical protein n=1 Tax=Actinophytocola sp. TaxID=1872138 RepID=UPI001328E17D|nr:hypothetical protein [Actinophytocola sp.]MPZ81776.1 hypothetical protein [Actinophytocola sp.]